MVYLQFKKSQKNSFTVEVDMNTPVHEVISKMLQVNNLRIYLWRLSKQLEELANKGVMKPEELQGISYDQLEKHAKEIGELSEEKQPYASRPVAQLPNRFVSDKANARYGILLPVEQTSNLLAVVKKAQSLLQKAAQPIPKGQFEQVIEQIRGVVMVTFPGYYGLPSWEPIVLILEGKIQCEEMASQEFEYFQENCNLWWAGQSLDKDKPISKYSGSNNKTKVIVKLQNPGQQQPPREPPVDPKAYKNMVQYYYKKTQQQKKFQKQSVSTFYQDPDWSKKSMKDDVHMDGPVKYKPF